MICRVHTKSGSIYAIDADARTVVRESGTGDATPRIQDATRRFESLFAAVGEPMVIVWGYNSEKGVTETTITSVVTELPE